MISKPTLILNDARCRSNIKEMCEKARRSDLVFRPHFKTHQSLEIGRWFKNNGVDKITVSSLSMAKYFAPEWNDITVAFPANLREMETINLLSRAIRLNLLVESEFSVEHLNANLTSEIGIFIKIDTGYHRTGIDPEQTETLESIADAIDSSPNMRFEGFLAHAGHSYNCRSKAEILKVHEQSVSTISQLKDKFKHRFPELIVSVGDTPTCSAAQDFSGVDEIRPGNFVFYDLSQQQIGACEFDRIAVAMACPIVSLHPERNELVIYGGGVHFSKENLEDKNDGTIYGRVVERNGENWSNVVPDTILRNLSQEHGVISFPKHDIEKYSIGDYLMILPVHSCMTANLMKEYRTIGGEYISRI